MSAREPTVRRRRARARLGVLILLGAALGAGACGDRGRPGRPDRIPTPDEPQVESALPAAPGAPHLG